jgi:hypothetical protein
MTVPDEEATQEKTYHDYLTELFKTLTILKNQSLLQKEELYKQLAIIEDALETMLNWIKLEKNGIRNFDTLFEWAEVLSRDETVDIDEIRYRLRVVLQPQVESFIQNVALGERSALMVRDVALKNLDNFDGFLKNVQSNNFKLLSLIGFEPDSQTSHLDLALINLYQGRFKDFDNELRSINSNLNPPIIHEIEEEE